MTIIDRVYESHKCRERREREREESVNHIRSECNRLLQKELKNTWMGRIGNPLVAVKMVADQWYMHKPESKRIKI